MKRVGTIEGFPVYFAEHPQLIAQSRGIGRFRKIVVGEAFYAFPERERMAILLHEVGHFRIRTLALRLAALWMIFVSPARLVMLCREQEFQADAYAKKLGYGRDLIHALEHLPRGSGPLHPSPEARIARLLAPTASSA